MGWADTGLCPMVFLSQSATLAKKTWLRNCILRCKAAAGHIRVTKPSKTTYIYTKHDKTTRKTRNRDCRMKNQWWPSLIENLIAAKRRIATSGDGTRCSDGAMAAMAAMATVGTWRSHLVVVVCRSLFWGNMPHMPWLRLDVVLRLCFLELTSNYNDIWTVLSHKQGKS